MEKMAFFPEKKADDSGSFNLKPKTEDEDLNSIASILVDAFLERKKRDDTQSPKKGSDILPSFNKRPGRRGKQLNYPRKDVPRLLPEEWI